MDFSRVEQLALYPYFNNHSFFDCASCRNEPSCPLHGIFKNTLIGNYVEVLKDEKCFNIFKYGEVYNINSSLTDHIHSHLRGFLENSEDGPKILLCIGIACLQLFVQNNFCGPMTGPDITDALPSMITEELTEEILRASAVKELVLDSEGVYNLLAKPEYLLLCRVIFIELQEFLDSCPSLYWWNFRYNFVHQKIADEFSSLIYESNLKAICKMELNHEFFEGQMRRELLALFYFEVCQFHLYYHNVPQARIYLTKAKEVLGLEVSLTGALGRRTRWQREDIAQLVVKVDFTNKSLTEDHQSRPFLLPTDLPKDVLLSDDTRLNRINYKDLDEDVVPDLEAIEQLLLFVNLILIRKSSANDAQLDEETKAFLWAMLQHPKNWALQLSALLLRSQVEVKETRAMERSMNQLEELVASTNREEPSRFERLKLIYASSLYPHWSVQQVLAHVFMRLGCIKTALEVFERLHLWEDVIICYNDLQMRQRSAEIIRQLLEKEETPKLLCLLGDATNEIEHYNKAWTLSDFKSARAQRCLGHYYYARNAYEKAIGHYEKSVELNSLQFTVWRRLGYCALQAEEYEKCANAYRRCSVLEPDSFECWNNLSQAYIKLGQLHRAWKSLQEAVRCNTANWRLWDNYLLVSTALGYMQQALYAYNKILSFKDRHVDTDIIGRIVNAILSNKTDPEGNQMNSLYKGCRELLARLTREVPTNPELWFLYADMIAASPEHYQENKHIAMQHYRKSVATATQKIGWEKDKDEVFAILMRSLRLVEIAREVLVEINPKAAQSEIASLRMLLKSTVASVKKGQLDIKTDDINETIKDPLTKVEEAIINLNESLSELKTHM